MLVDVLKALSDETRLRILNLLCERSLCVCDFTAILNITQSKASRHLIYLKNTQLVTDRKNAQWVYYSLIKRRYYTFIDDIIANARKTAVFESDLNRLMIYVETKNIECE